MNNRFKFRVWYMPEYNKPRMIYGAEKTYDCMYGEPEIIYADCFGCLLDSKEYILMQSTGLKDKNGKLIYEGDILGGSYGNLYIHYCDNCKQFQLKANDYGCMACEGDIHWCELVEDENELEVIGNIYENPKLLEDTECQK